MFSALRTLYLVLFLVGPGLLYAHHTPDSQTNSRHKIIFKAESGDKPATYYVHPVLGSDDNSGRTKEKAFKSLDRINTLQLHPGDSILLAADQIFNGSIHLRGQSGNLQRPIYLGSVRWGKAESVLPATIDFKGRSTGIYISDCNYWEINNIRLTADGYGVDHEEGNIRSCT